MTFGPKMPTLLHMASMAPERRKPWILLRQLELPGSGGTRGFRSLADRLTKTSPETLRSTAAIAGFVLLGGLLVGTFCTEVISRLNGKGEHVRNRSSDGR
ncbi:unnamed protein product [Symbiodinium natans]|uniref:Uncharacterized protein n=1 Tax=Symbiodinium natans TaxID=878477 RepID=A0A812UCE2_9DINO|nr:unnamed protein product [Symbiodinium natans]